MGFISFDVNTFLHVVLSCFPSEPKNVLKANFLPAITPWGKNWTVRWQRKRMTEELSLLYIVLRWNIISNKDDTCMLLFRKTWMTRCLLKCEVQSDPKSWKWDEKLNREKEILHSTSGACHFRIDIFALPVHSRKIICKETFLTVYLLTINVTKKLNDWCSIYLVFWCKIFRQHTNTHYVFYGQHNTIKASLKTRWKDLIRKKRPETNIFDWVLRLVTFRCCNPWIIVLICSRMLIKKGSLKIYPQNLFAHYLGITRFCP